MPIRIFLKREVKIGFRNPWTYSFTAIFSLFFVLVLFVGAGQNWQGFTFASATMMNLMLYLLPLMALLFGSFSLATEREEGNWRLWLAYPVTTTQFLIGKTLGLLIVLGTVVSFSIGFAVVLGSIFGAQVPVTTLLIFYAASLGIALFFTLLSIVIGSLVRTRWQALAYSVGVWFILIIAWPALWFALIGILPYPWIKTVLLIGFALNPAEWMRIAAILAFGGGSIFGADYFHLVMDAKKPLSWFLAAVYMCGWIVFQFWIANVLWEKRRYLG